MPSPLEEFNSENPDRWEILQDIPEWERQAVLGWLYLVYVHPTTDYMGSTRNNFDNSAIRSIETVNRILLSNIGITATDWQNLRQCLSELLDDDVRKFVLFLELTVKYIRDDAGVNLLFGSHLKGKEDVLDFLQRILNNGSAWTIVRTHNSNVGLVERVDERITEIATNLASNDLKAAWEAAFSMEPNPETAIEKAQKAIEHFATEAGLTNATSSVFGTLLGDIKTVKGRRYFSVAKSSYDLANSLAGQNSTEEDVNDQFADWVALGMNLIQKTHPRRHVSRSTNSFTVEPEAAKQAVIIATMLCHFIKNGYIYRSSEPSSDSTS